MMEVCAGACAYDLWKEALDHWSALFNLMTLIVAFAALNTWRHQRKAAMADEIYALGVSLINLKFLSFSSFLILSKSSNKRLTYKIAGGALKIIERKNNLLEQAALRVRHARRILNSEELAEWLTSYRADILEFQRLLEETVAAYKRYGEVYGQNAVQPKLERLWEMAEVTRGIMPPVWERELEKLLRPYQ